MITYFPSKPFNTARSPLVTLVACLIVSFAFAITAVAQDTPTRKKAFQDLAPSSGFDRSKEGFLIVTTNDLTHRLKQLQPFITHKSKARGFRMYVATEDELGNEVGREKAFKIRNWLQKHYEQLGIQYVMFIGKGHPEEGEVPMMKAGIERVPSGDRWEALNDEQRKWYSENSTNGIVNNTGSLPTDYFYVDLSGKWDLNGDGLVSHHGDYEPGGIEPQPEVYVGRIPYYGEDSDYGKAVDTDFILQRSIRYDNETDIAWRYGFTQLRQWDMLPEEVWFEIETLEPNGINYYRDKDYQDVIGFPGYDLQAEGTGMEYNVAKLQKLEMGYTRLGGHGSPTAMHGISSGGVRRFLNDRRPTLVNMGSCDSGKIEHQHNLAYTMLRYHAIGTHAGTRSVSGFGGKHSKPYWERLLEDRNSMGQAWWSQYGDRFEGRGISGTALLINVYGDPTIVPFPTGLDLPYSFITKPVRPYHKVAKNHASIPELPHHTLELHNHNDRPVAVAISTSTDWLAVEQRGVRLNPGAKQSVRFAIVPERARYLTPGIHQAEIFLDDGNGYICTRLFYLEIADAKLQSHFAFENPKGVFKDPVSKKEFKVGVRPKDLPNVDDATVEGVIGMAANSQQYELKGQITMPNNGHFTYAFWIKRNQPEIREHIVHFPPFMDVVADGKGLSIDVKDFDYWGRIKGQHFKDDIRFQWDAGKWTHLALTYDQDKGELKVYRNGDLADTMQTEPYLILAPKHFAFRKFQGAIDEFTTYNKVLKADEIVANMDATFIESPSPAHLAQRVIPGQLEFNFLAGEHLEVTELAIRERSNPSNYEKIVIDNQGKWVAKTLKPNTTYQWVAMGKTKEGRSARGPIWQFSTSKTLVENGSFEEDVPHAWSGPVRVERNANHAVQGDGSLVLPQGQTTVYKVTERIKPGFGYNLKLTMRTAWKKRVTYELFTKRGSQEQVLATRSLDCYQDRRGKHFELDFYALNGKSYIGQDLYVRIKSDPELGSETWIDDVTLMPYTHKSTNRPPEVIKNLAEFKPLAELYNNLFVIRLNDFIGDPEGDVLTYRKLSGPDWLEVRHGELITNFGPALKDLGLNTIVVEATDSQQASIEVTFRVGVVKPDQAKVDLTFSPKSATTTGGITEGDPARNWSNVDGTITWELPELPRGTYEVTLNYGCDQKNQGSRVALSIGSEKLSFTTQGAQERWAFADHTIGTIKLNARSNSMQLKASSKARDWVMDLRSVRLKLVQVD